MSIIYKDDNRQAVPRCLSYEAACSLGLLTANKRIEEVHRPGVKDSDAMKEWMEDHRLATAVDLVAEALIIRDFESSEAIAAAKFILDEAPSSSWLINELSSHFLETPGAKWSEPSDVADIYDIRRDIARLKRSVRNYAINPIAWCNLSLDYAAVGQDEKARMAMNVATNLGGNNRFILRSASRCFMHLGEPDRGVAILNRSGLCGIDPWLTSAEIAISESSGLRSRCIGKAKDLISNDNLTPFSRSELAVGLGTLEIKNGSVGQGKKIMRRALIEPTENALAQAEWVGSFFKVDFDDMVKLSSEVTASYEANALYSYFRKEFKDSLKAAQKWGRFQFLSSRPIIHSTFIASCVLGDDLGAIKIFEEALPAQKDEALAMNNYAFALGRIGRTREAADTLQQCISKASPEVRLAICATTGLICFREGNIEGGRRLYKEAVGGLEQLKYHNSAAIAKYFWAVEEKRIGSEDANARIEEAKKAIEQQNVFALEDLAKKL
jgi:tetratricopeptide (TPR) repeat protein